MFSSPEPEPGHYENPAKKARQKLLDEYNAAIKATRNNVFDAMGMPDKTTELKLIAIYSRAITKLGHADNMIVIGFIQKATALELSKQTQISNAA